MRRTSVQLGHPRACALALVLLICLTLVVQGAHVCQFAPHSEPGVQAKVGSGVPVCAVCAAVHSLLFAVFFLLLFLMPSSSPAVFHPVEARKSFWREVRLYMRPPPAF